RAEMLAELMRLRYGIAVAGSHGKTTTTSMIAAVLSYGQLDPTIVVGGIVKTMGTNARLGKGDFMVVEADESDGSFLRLSPVISVLTNIDEEHMDYYKDMDELEAAFLSFLNKIPFYGLSVLCIDCPRIKSLSREFKKRILTYGFDQDAELRAEDVLVSGFETKFNVFLKKSRLGSVNLNVPGRHNAQNSLAAIAVGMELGMSFKDVSYGLSEFKGIDRRLQVKGEGRGVLVIDDYAHHPKEIEVTISAIKESQPGRIVVISDFSNVDGPDLLAVKKAISSEEIIVNFVDVINDAENAGIIEMDVGKHNIKIFVKNFNPVQKQIKLKLVKDGKVIAESGTIMVLPNSVESFLFDDTPVGVSRIVLEPEDDLDVDNIVYISAPLKKRVNVLFITNRRNTNLENALLASRDISLNVVNPPVLTLNTGGDRIEPFEHDVIVVHNINNVGRRDGILPGTFQDLSNYVKKGGKLIITAQDDLDKFNKVDLDIVNLKNLVQDTKRVCLDVVNELTKTLQNCFSTVSQYFDAAADEDTNVIASISDTPVLAVKEHFRGKIFYYGIIDQASDFRTLPSYPVFWNSLINFMATRALFYRIESCNLNNSKQEGR
ncbi:MAG: UDP-N-acetylmuramate--L-alanine ligase, partial [Candidatus Dadabacteria bacterium]|nr:UDP-N-acetylmuramate--L-alanine ligase [Candidatus Dadabacteria bacterium]